MKARSFRPKTATTTVCTAVPLAILLLTTGSGIAMVSSPGLFAQPLHSEEIMQRDSSPRDLSPTAGNPSGDTLGNRPVPLDRTDSRSIEISIMLRWFDRDRLDLSVTAGKLPGLEAILSAWLRMIRVFLKVLFWMTIGLLQPA